ncbi:thymus-specific serine protease [Chiloscyllium plagiosum]|uniref:thymus-specific serine protease n=1 Tax=Chiloscyllium plagiosum TaxID=36176 RepID=UPI001CB7F822|nr:thymus-specific serine protease [Chiloscyllium plagiosum]
MLLVPMVVLFLPWLQSALGGRNMWLIKQQVLQSQEQRILKHLLKNSNGMTEPKEGLFPQPLDHFNRRNNGTFKQRYWVNANLWEPRLGPVFLFIGGEQVLLSSSVLAGEHVDLAQKYRALLVSLEHRYYGKSINPDGLTNQNIQFLSSQQALADLATFHEFIGQQYNLTRNNRWVCFGGSYPGSLSAWFRLKFPHLAFAAVASSAPVRAQLDFTGFNKVVSHSLSNPVVGGSMKCRSAVASAFSQLDRIMAGSNTSQLEVDFKSCQKLNGSDDRAEFACNLASIVMGTVQYNKVVLSRNIANLCQIMTNQSLGSVYQRLMVLNKDYMDSIELQCVDNSHQNILANLRSTEVKPYAMADRQWYYQMCTEFGYYQTCEDKGCPLSHWLTLRFELDICAEVFGIDPGSVQDAVDFTNSYYGADHPASSRIIFVNGDIDPWHVLSVLKNQSCSEVALVINGTAHCANMNPVEQDDPPSLRQARQKIDYQIGAWLAEEHLSSW